MTTSLYAATARYSSDPSLSGFSSLSRRSLEAVECPECGKRTIVKRSHNTFDCLNCDFHKALPPVARSSQESVRAVSTAQPRFYSRTPNGLPSGMSGDTISPLLTVDPNYQPLDMADEMSESSKMQPLLFAAIAVIFGILFL